MQNLVFAKKMARKKSIGDFPDDLLMDIFSRLPAERLIKFKSVCKPLCSLFSQTFFIEVRSTLKNPNIFLTFIPPKPRNPEIPPHFYSDFPFRPHFVEENTTNLPPIFKTLDSEILKNPIKLNLGDLPLDIKVIGSCNGLLCLSDNETVLSLLNPTTREHVPLEFPPLKEVSYLYLSHTVTGFGYDPVGNEYKVVGIRFTGFKSVGFTSMEVMVYTLGSNLWRAPRNFLSSLKFFISHGRRTAYFDGIVHWIGLRFIGNGKDKYKEKTVVSFNLTTEDFGVISMPSTFRGREVVKDVDVGVWDGCLALFHNYESCVDIWIRKDNGMVESWMKILCLVWPSYYGLQPLFVRKNGEVLLHKDGTLLSYDLATHLADWTYVRDEPYKFTTTTYVEAVTSISSLMVRDKMLGH